MFATDEFRVMGIKYLENLIRKPSTLMKIILLLRTYAFSEK